MPGNAYENWLSRFQNTASLVFEDQEQNGPFLYLSSNFIVLNIFFIALMKADLVEKLVVRNLVSMCVL